MGHPKAKTLYCDYCGQDWEVEFFCKTCSGLHEFPGEVEQAPNIMWDGNPGDEYVWQNREPEFRDVCMNCCNGHSKE